MTIRLPSVTTKHEKGMAQMSNRKHYYTDSSVMLFAILFQQGLDAIKFPAGAFDFCDQEGILYDYGSANAQIMREKIVDYLIKKTKLLQNKGAE